MVSRYLSIIVHWLLQRISRIPEKDRNNTKWFMLAFLIATLVVSIIYAIGNPTGASLFSHITNIGELVLLNVLLYMIWTFIISAILSFLYIPLPRLLFGSFSYTIFVCVTSLLLEDSGTLFSFIAGISYGVLWLLITSLILLFFHSKKAGVFSLLVIFSVVVSIVFLTLENKNMYRELPAMAEGNQKLLSVEDPSKDGDYSYTFLAYGSGNDKHRTEFGADVDIMTPTVDASHFISKWGEEREAFWGFDQSQLPINGRLWIPDGEGPFPVILMVHGNHTMEDFSTSGYDYLGELLASRGFIAISADEDFINYSNVSGSPNDNYRLRAWIVMKHLVQLITLNDTPGNALFGKVDFDNVGLVGHSRGGQAVSMVADYKRFFDDEPWFKAMENIHIQGIVALAPTDKRVNDKRPNLDNVSYLVIQGAQDADINTFQGDRQFYRTTLAEDSNTFKSSLYIAGANHSQFNTEWGTMDSSLPEGLFLNQMQTLNPEEQRQIAKVYISAFFERTIHEKIAYEDLFGNYQYGKHWLPDTVMVTKYENSTYDSLIQFKRNQQVLANEVTTDLRGFSEVEIITPEDRRNNSRPVDAVYLEWESTADYTINLVNWDHNVLRDRENLVLTMANINEDSNSTPDIEVVLETTDDVTVSLPLSEFMAFPSVIMTDFTHFGLFDKIFKDGKYENSWEANSQTFEVPFDALEEENASFDKDNLHSVTLRFHTPSGKILVESIGLSD